MCAGMHNSVKDPVKGEEYTSTVWGYIVIHTAQVNEPSKKASVSISISLIMQNTTQSVTIK